MGHEGRWADPTSGLPLRFGTHAVRLRLALVLLFVGGILVQLTSAYTLLIGVGGLAASVAGWCVVPAPGWRRALAVAPAVLGVAGMLGGASTAALVALTLAAWLFVRLRPAASYVVMALPVASSILLAQVFPQYGAGVIVAGTLGFVLAVAAWVGWLIAILIDRRTVSRRMRIS